MTSEWTPLLGKNSEQPSTENAPTAYFIDGVHRRSGSSVSVISKASQHSQYSTTAPWLGTEIVDPMPAGAMKEEFAPRPVQGRVAIAARKTHMRPPSVGGDWLSYIPLRGKLTSATIAPTPETQAAEKGDIGTLLLPRKVPVKVEPKVQFANERCFLTWLHLVVTLGAASVMILKYSADENIANILYGLILLPVSLAFTIYALFQYKRRAHMIKEHLPGPYIDTVGPTTLTLILGGSIIAQFCARFSSYMNS